MQHAPRASTIEGLGVPARLLHTTAVSRCTNVKSRFESCKRSPETEIQTCRFFPCSKASRTMAASCLPLPTPAPSPNMNPVIVHRRSAENRNIQRARTSRPRVKGRKYFVFGPGVPKPGEVSLRFRGPLLCALCAGHLACSWKGRAPLLSLGGFVTSGCPYVSS